MTKNELVDRISKKAGLSRKDAAAAVDAFLESINDAYKEGGEVSFTGFGRFSPNRPGEVATSDVPRFTAEAALKQAAELRESVDQLEEEGEDFRVKIKESLDELRSISGSLS